MKENMHVMVNEIKDIVQPLRSAGVFNNLILKWYPSKAGDQKECREVSDTSVCLWRE